MANQFTIEAPDFDRIFNETGPTTRDGITTLWRVANDEAESRRRGVREAIERQCPKEIILSLAANQNNFNTEFATTLRSDGAASVNITGFQARPEPTILFLVVLGSGTITLKHNDVNSIARNRILTYTAADIAVGTNQAIRLDYLNERWRVMEWL